MCIYFEYCIATIANNSTSLRLTRGHFLPKKFKVRFKCQVEEQKENVIITILKLDKVKLRESQETAAPSAAVDVV